MASTITKSVVALLRLTYILFLVLISGIYLYFIYEFCVLGFSNNVSKQEHAAILLQNVGIDASECQAEAFTWLILAWYLWVAGVALMELEGGMTKMFGRKRRATKQA